MTSLLVLALILLLAWAWAVWQRDRAALFMHDWSYVLLVGSLTCFAMSLGLWLR